MNKPFYIEALGHRYLVELDEYHNTYFVTSDTGYAFKVGKETFDNEYLNKQSTKRLGEQD